MPCFWFNHFISKGYVLIKILGQSVIEKGPLSVPFFVKRGNFLVSKNVRLPVYQIGEQFGSGNGILGVKRFLSFILEFRETV